MNSSIKAFTLLSLLTVPLILTSCGGGDDSHGHQHAAKHLNPVAVKTTQATLENVVLFNETTGTVRSRNRASIAPKVTGDIAEIHVVPGQAVKKDELLVKISAQEITSKLQSAQASVDKARRDLKREEELSQKGSSTTQMVNDLKDQLRIAEAMMSEAKAMLSYTEIRAPFEGVITRKHVNEGDLALPGHPLVEIENLSSLRVESDVPEALGTKLRMDMKIDVLVSGLDNPLAGKIEEIAPAADPMSRTFPVKIALPMNPHIKSGQFAKIRIPTESVKSILVDQKAVSNWGQIERVFVVSDGHIHMRIIKTGVKVGDKIEILSGLSGDEELAIGTGSPLIDGSPVQ